MTLASTPTSCPGCGVNILTAEDAARLLGVSYSRVRAILRKDPKRLRAFKIGKAWAIPENAITEFVRFPPHRPSNNTSSENQK